MRCLSLDGTRRQQDRSVTRRDCRQQERSRARLQLLVRPKSANITWNEQTLDKFLKSPSADVHGTKMFISVPNAENRHNIIAYLATLKP
jgi:hypothetical protein